MDEVLPAALVDAALTADVVVFEHDLDAPPAPAGRIRPTPPLDEVIPAALYGQAKLLWIKWDGEEPVLRMMTPLEASTELATGRNVRQFGLSKRFGVDAQLWRRVPSERRDWVETMESVNQLLANVPLPEQVRELEFVVEGKELHGLVGGGISAWRASDESRLGSVGDAIYSRVPMMADQLLFRRDLGFFDAIQMALCAEISAVFVLGAAHVVGEHGVVGMLRHVGHTVALVNPS